MWPFNKKASEMGESGLFQEFTDWHSHLLPGVDDGIHTMEETLAVLRKYEELGVKRVWLTPHVMEETPNSTGFLRTRFDDLKATYTGPVELRLASENMLDSLFEERIRVGDVLPIGSSEDHLLIETSYVNPPLGMEQMIQQIMAHGLTPVLAHPERYRYMEYSDYERWKDRGLLFQVNFISLLGGYGETARRKCEWLLREGLVELTGSDLHRLSMLEHVLDRRPKNRDSLSQLVGVARNPGLD